ncbi:MAG: c-type cytochrome, partial [Halothiobacillaceae bacterium]
MAPNAAALSDADIANLAAHIATLGAAAPSATSAASAPAATSAPASAPAPAPVAAAGDAAAGKAKFATCAACHGANGEGAGAFPKLAGLSAADVETKLKKYRAGEQVGPQTALMAPNAAALSDAEIANLAAYIATLGAAAPAATSAAPAPAATAAPAPIVDKVVLNRGKAIYTTCAICHGKEEDKASRLLNAPLLPGHPASAVTALMKMYRDGKPVGP